MKDRQFNSIFSECLNRLLQGETIDRCVQQYPEQAEELRSLLETAAGIKKAVSIEPSPDFRTRARAQFRAALLEQTETKHRPLFQWMPNWSVALAGVLIILIAGAGTMVAAQTSMPDQPLYAVKLATEEARIKLTRTDLGKAELYANLADRRVSEITYLSAKGKDNEIEKVSQKFDANVAMVAMLLSGGQMPMQAQTKMLAPPGIASLPENTPVPSEGSGIDQSTPTEDATLAATARSSENEANPRKAKLKQLITRLAEEHPKALNAALDNASPQAKDALQQAIDQSRADYQQALDVLNSPED
jgi:hypothetical protein